MLAILGYRVTSNLVDTSSRQIFNAASKTIEADLLAVYSPVKKAVSILSYSQVVGSSAIEKRLDYVPMMVNILRQLPVSTAIQSASDQGDYFIVRKLVVEALAERFDAPAQTVFSADYIEGATGRHQRWFYDDDLNILEHRQLPDSEYDPRTRPWFHSAIKSGKAVFGDPYVFYFMGEVGMTPGSPSPDLKSVIAVDITLKTISQSLADISVTPSAVAALSHNGSLIAWSGNEPILIKDEKGNLRQRTLKELEHPIINAIANNDEPQDWLIYRTKMVLSDDFQPEFILAVPENEYLINLQQTRNWVLIGAFVLLALLIPVSWIFAHRITSPLHALHTVVNKTGKGDFDFWLPEVKSFDEVGELNIAFRKMRNSLKDYIRNLADATAARERLESELDIARKIQMGMVAGHGKMDVKVGNYQVFARLIPAKAVGGDLYVLFKLPDGKFFIGVGDVSDKGVPAALFMARMVSLSKLLVPKMESLSKMLYELNEELTEDNDASMFVTYFCAIVDPEKSLIKYACAGHNPPIIIEGTQASYLEFEAGPPLGALSGMSYPESERAFPKGAKLVIYSDGITEAFDVNNVAFTEKRLLDLLAEITDSGAMEMGQSVLESVEMFTGDAPQSDDITLFVLESS
ncbi:MAG: SpoIIE family protein phosphatase [Gammaproteobacteria bacterium]